MCAQHFFGFPFNRPLEGKKTLSKPSTAMKNQTFGAGVTKNINRYESKRLHVLYKIIKRVQQYL